MVQNGKRYYVYRNLRTHQWSLMDGATQRVDAHLDGVLLKDVEFRVRPGGREKVLRDRQKTVHAFAIGHLEQQNGRRPVPRGKAAHEVTYDPYAAGHFFPVEHPDVTIESAVQVFLDPAGKVWAWDPVFTTPRGAVEIF